ncbi:hypothetical protein EHQ76_06535 [Leptospira barantonii]|uniref:Uncharacterized protein n=1 Tax=Leptospira barantonii TaxID=2023184 RepID=A0A5F2BKG9_9LEPT|nr:hypothetical protein EHQ76_06535 [Leptospira barantonii]
MVTRGFVAFVYSRAFVVYAVFVLYSVSTSETSLFAVESRIGFTMETYESRYSHTAKENWFFKTSNCDKPRQIRSADGIFLPITTNTIPAAPNRFCGSGFIETRNGTPLLSAKIDHRFFRASFGHRFRPLENFYFLRDNDFYTALPEIDQATHKAGFFGFKHGDWSLGTYYSEQEAKRRPGFYLLSPWKLFELALSPESKKHYVSLNFQSKNFSLPGPRIVSRIQTLGEKKEFDGTFYSSLVSERLDSEFRITGYRGKSGDLFALDPNRNELKGKAELARFAITSHSVFSIEWIRAWNHSLSAVDETFGEDLQNQNSPSKRWEIIAGKAPIVYDPTYGGILFSLRNYTNETLGRGLYYGLYQKRFTIEAGQEWRINGDAISEGKWSFRLNEVWNLEGAFLFQKEGNRTDSLFEARTARDETSLIFTDRSSSFRLRLLSPYVALSVSHSRKKEHKTDGIWINLQVQFPF